MGSDGSRARLSRWGDGRSRLDSFSHGVLGANCGGSLDRAHGGRLCGSVRFPNRGPVARDPPTAHGSTPGSLAAAVSHPTPWRNSARSWPSNDVGTGRGDGVCFGHESGPVAAQFSRSTAETEPGAFEHQHSSRIQWLSQLSESWIPFGILEFPNQPAAPDHSISWMETGDVGSRSACGQRHQPQFCMCGLFGC
jgi:hypothetical protein